MEEKPSYYAILPAEVRYDEKLNSTEKLLYAEITALSSKEGICWASNRYFANLYNMTTRNIINIINKLKKLGYIRVEHIYKNNSKLIIKRNIYLVKNISLPSEKYFTRGSEKKFTDNNINNNNINRIIPLNNFLQDDLDNLYEN